MTQAGDYLVDRLHAVSAGTAAARSAAGACCWRSISGATSRREVADLARARGLLVNAPRPDSLRFMPALTISDQEIDTMIDILDGTLADALKA